MCIRDSCMVEEEIPRGAAFNMNREDEAILSEAEESLAALVEDAEVGPLAGSAPDSGEEARPTLCANRASGIQGGRGAANESARVGSPAEVSPGSGEPAGRSFVSASSSAVRASHRFLLVLLSFLSLVGSSESLVALSAQTVAQPKVAVPLQSKGLVGLACSPFSSGPAAVNHYHVDGVPAAA